MKNTDIVALTTEDLKAKIVAEKENLAKTLINHSVSPLDNPIKLREMRKTVARLSTELTKRNKASK